MKRMEKHRVTGLTGWRAAGTRGSKDATVLLVTADADLRAAVMRSLDRAGYRVIVARHSGHALLAGMTCGGIDVLLTESDLDDMPGAALAGMLQRHHPRLRAVLMANGGTRPQPGVIVRPFTRDDLLSHVQAAAALTSQAS